MKIDQVLQRTESKNLKDQSPVEKAKDAPVNPRESSTGGPLKTDTVTISEQARSLQRAQNGPPVAEPAVTPDNVRQEKVSAARTRLDNGQLLSGEIVDQTAEAIINSGDLGDIINSRRLSAGFGRSGVDELSGSGAGRLDAVKQRVQSGYYNSPEVVDNIAERMLEDLLA